MVNALEWRHAPRPHIRMIDQTALPTQEIYLEVDTIDALVDAIQRLAVRGAPALGAAGALGVALAMHLARSEAWSEERLDSEIRRVRDARPTAVNLAWGADRASTRRGEGYEGVLAEALAIVEEDGAANRHLAKLGADWILAATGKDEVRVVTHCNTGALATSQWGTAYGIIHELHDRGSLGLVYADETRPLLQGSRLTSWELTKDGIDHLLEVDGAAASTILRGLVDVAIIGADRITANGDTANKVGSVALALACARAGIPFVVAAPFSTVDLQTETGDEIHIELRDDDEVIRFGGTQVAPPGTRVFNPAFDVTPHDLISAIVTERGVVEPAAAPTADLLRPLAP
ncbi:S-methyl-5-thioribose-1-phosphate isomerase [Cellulomonas fengjieae]|uniref:S-methyl-5-thioribose-1-phosphate isomerase n=1 Tax=Cellulomonas fengjieae TaxID=2819978 RepID=UPI001AAEDC73|nr:S-methyl-5-thioribose-1-phosphate isomerase [Cellulomonas fengjieae]MBO3102186.1 S-methyl-5-thioribose-1-phosphate isomerase [Cellulomonas fengjieae]